MVEIRTMDENWLTVIWTPEGQGDALVIDGEKKTLAEGCSFMMYKHAMTDAMRESIRTAPREV